jgi:hypothetical protein
MNFKTQYPEYAAIEQHIHRARAERSVAIAHAIASAVEAVVRGTRNFVQSLGKGLQAQHERQMIEADSFLKRSVPRY